MLEMNVLNLHYEDASCEFLGTGEGQFQCHRVPAEDRRTRLPVRTRYSCCIRTAD